jgi:DNA-binding transcriptional LysR family regulator
LQRGRLTIAANEYTCLYLLPMIHAYQKKAPKVRVTVQRALASKISEELMLHSVELGVVSFRPDDPQLRSVIVYRDPLVCAVAPRHPMARAKAVSIRELGGESFVAHNVPSPLRQKVEQAFRSHHTQLNMNVELPSLEAIKRYVAMGTGVALVPSLAVQAEMEAGALVSVPVPELQFERRLRLVHRRGANLSHAAVQFLQTVESHAAKHGDPYSYVAEGKR